jgi:hypothetical protein
MEMIAKRDRTLEPAQIACSTAAVNDLYLKGGLAKRWQSPCTASLAKCDPCREGAKIPASSSHKPSNFHSRDPTSNTPFSTNPTTSQSESSPRNNDVRRAEY